MPSKLEAMLKEMLEDAMQKAQIPQKRKLHGGLHLAVTAYSRGMTISIARDNVYPSEKEWKTICANFPYYIGTPEPDYIVDMDGRKALRANVPSRQEVAQRML